MTDIKQTLIEETKGLQEFGRKDEEEPRLRWFSRLVLEDVTVEDKWITFIWRDPADGTRHGWRWEILRDRLYLFAVHLHEDLDTTEPTEPDENGVRWWGVFENGHVVASWWKVA